MLKAWPIVTGFVADASFSMEVAGCEFIPWCLTVATCSCPCVTVHEAFSPTHALAKPDEWRQSKPKAHCPPQREAAGNERRPSARRSLSLNAAPSTSAASASERDRRLATAWAAAKHKSAD